MRCDEEDVQRAAREERGISPQRAVPPRGRGHVPSDACLQELSASTGMEVETIRLVYSGTNAILKAELTSRRVQFRRHANKAQ